MVNNSPTFNDVFNSFHNWYLKNSNNGQEKSILVTSGNWDLGNIFVDQYNLFPSMKKIPEFMCTWINIKKVI